MLAHGFNCLAYVTCLHVSGLWGEIESYGFVVVPISLCCLAHREMKWGRLQPSLVTIPILK